MDRRERFNDLTLLLRSALQGWQANLWTALPATYQGAGSKVGTANAQPTVQVQLTNPSTSTFDPPVNLPMCLDCPVIFPGGGGAHLTFPLAVGDEGLLVFASRCIDNWWLSGGQQAQAEYRMHDLSDGFFVPGCFSQPRAPSAAWSAATTRLTADDGLTYVELDAVGHIVNIVAPGGLAIDGPLDFDGDVDVSGTLTVGGVVVSGAGGVLSITGGLALSGAATAVGNITAGLGGADQVTLQGHEHTYTKSTTGATTPFPTTAPIAGT